jgi:hypothetical protein
MDNFEKWIEAKLSDIYITIRETNVDSVDFLILEQKSSLLNEVEKEYKKLKK